MAAEMKPKLSANTWDPRFEKELLGQWQKEKLHRFEPDGEVFSIDTPPPYPSGAWHIGAVAHYSLIDMIARSARMRGFSVLFPFGLDRNGINIERTVEKKTGKTIHQFERGEFIRLCRQEIDRISKDVVETAKDIGMSCNLDEYYMTDSDEYRAMTQATFIDLWNKGLVYEDYRPTNWCPHCRTTIADAELEYEDRQTTLNYVRFRVKEGGEELLIATTRPELLCACQAVLVHPEDDRYMQLHGKSAVLPLYDRAVPIIAHEYAKREFGTGVVMICSYGDQADVKIFREMNLEPIQAIGLDGKMNERAGKYKGMRIEEARKAVVDDLKKTGLLAKQEQTIHRTPLCERSKTPVEFIAMSEWYLSQLPSLDALRKIADEMDFHPARNKQILLDWIDAVTIDWPISRRRYYHTEIPIWFCESCNKPLVPKPGKYYRPWHDPAPFEKCPQCGGKKFRGETRVFDTWMDSSISNLVATGYGRDEKLFKKAFPCTIRPQGREIVRTWLFYTMLKSHLLFGKKAFKHVWITGLGMDERGRKMSKSLGNIIEPSEILGRSGADAFRFWAASETAIGDDFRISRERIAGAAKFLTKFWNVARFISMFPEARKPAKLCLTDAWILSEMACLARECEEAYQDFDFFTPATRCREFVWNVFAPHYLEMAKNRAYEGDASALYALHSCLKALLELLAPIIPFSTDKVYRDVYGGSVHAGKFPKPAAPDEKMLALTPKVIEFNSSIWKQKKDKGMALNAEFKGAVPKELAALESDLAKMHRLIG
jgi:valyl-tRNA synthetase